MAQEIMQVSPLPPFMMNALQQADFIVHDHTHIKDPGALAKVTALVGTGAAKVDKKLLMMLPHVKLIAICGVGYDGVDVDAAKEKGIVVTHTPGVLTDDVADLAMGLVLSAYATGPGQHQLLNIMIGFGIAGTGFGVVLAVVGRATSAENRSMALGVATAAGSAGQVFGAPLAEILLQSHPWQTVFMIFAIIILATLVALPFLSTGKVATRTELEDSLGTVLKRAFKDPSYTLIFLGFFSCGYQLAFITAHFPAFITDFCGAIESNSMLAGLGIKTTSALGAASISVIGLFNIVGTLTAGWLGKRYTKKYLLAGVYTGRTIAAAAFILMPITPASVLIFSAVMGALWLATVPLTSGLVAHIYGIRYMGTLYGFIFLSHQIGGFLGVWLGGKMFDITGDYTLVWWIGVGVGAFSAIVHLPVRERPLQVAAA